jgi:F-type H+-transporting ATPase subunit delta
MKLSKEARVGAKSLAKACMSGGALDRSKVSKVLAEVSNRRPAGYAQMLHEFHRLIRLEVERKTALIQTAAPIEAASKESLTRAVRQRFGADVETQFSVNSELIAGVRIRVGSDLLDANVKERLSRLEAELAH